MKIKPLKDCIHCDGKGWVKIVGTDGEYEKDVCSCIDDQAWGRKDKDVEMELAGYRALGDRL